MLIQRLGIHSREVWTGLMLLSGSCIDLRRRRLPRWYFLLCAIGSVLLVLWRYRDGWLQRASGAMLGVAVLIVARLTREAIGAGDALMLLIIGFLFGWAGSLEILLYALFLAALAAVALLLLQKAGRRSRMPFYPFLTLGFGLYLWTLAGR